MVNTIEQQKKIWGGKYSQHGRFFGEKPSDSAHKLISVLRNIASQNSKDNYVAAPDVLDVGAGTGRDSVAIALKTAANVDALDCSPKAIELGKAFAEEKGVGNRITWIESDFLGFEPEKKYDAIFSHRWFHLNEISDLPAAVQKLSDSLKDGGLLVISARRIEDFNSGEMKRIGNESDGVIEYTKADKAGMRAQLFNPDKLKELFGKHFDMDNVDFSERVEPDNSTSDQETKYVMMSVFKKAVNPVRKENTNRWSKRIAATGQQAIATVIQRASNSISGKSHLTCG